MTESWFSSLSRDPLELFRGISNQPFPELHCAALKVFTVGILIFFTGPHGTGLVQLMSAYDEPVPLPYAGDMQMCRAVSALCRECRLVRETCTQIVSAHGLRCCGRGLTGILQNHRIDSRFLICRQTSLLLTQPQPSS